MLTVLFKRKRFHIVLILLQKKKIGQPKIVNEVAKHQSSIFYIYIYWKIQPGL